MEKSTQECLDDLDKAVLELARQIIKHLKIKSILILVTKIIRKINKWI